MGIAAGTNGVFMTTWTEYVDHDNCQIGAARSLDGGANWEDPFFLEVMSCVQGDPGKPNTGTDGVGTWVIVWNSGVEGPRYVYSDDNGSNWSAEGTMDAYPPLGLGTFPYASYALAGNSTDGILLAYQTTGDVDGLPPAGDDLDIFYARVTALDCNTNGVDDLDDIALGTSADCNCNSIPDECENLAGGDFDVDGDVDLDDFAKFLDCFAGPNALPDPVSPDCLDTCLNAFDFDDDTDVDMKDFALFQAVFSS